MRDGSFSHFFFEKVGKGTVPHSQFPFIGPVKWEKEPSLIPSSPLQQNRPKQPYDKKFIY